jgi:hypothetical protein
MDVLNGLTCVWVCVGVCAEEESELHAGDVTSSDITKQTTTKTLNTSVCMCVLLLLVVVGWGWGGVVVVVTQ